MTSARLQWEIGRAKSVIHSLRKRKPSDCFYWPLLTPQQQLSQENKLNPKSRPTPSIFRSIPAGFSPAAHAMAKIKIFSWNVSRSRTFIITNERLIQNDMQLVASILCYMLPHCGARESFLSIYQRPAAEGQGARSPRVKGVLNK